jgi:hypothetical protein
MISSSQVPVSPRLLLVAWLGASVGCLSVDSLSSYSSGGPVLRDPPSVEGPSEATLEPQTEPEEQMPVSEGVPGQGEIALEPTLSPEGPAPEGTPPEGTQSDATQTEPPASEPEVTCAGPGEFSSADSQTCYLAESQSATWTDAFGACQMWGGGLVIIDSREEDELIGQHIAATSWTGASDLVQEGRMLWIGGAPVTFANWAPGQPDDFQGREDCVVKTMPAGSWNDLPCRNLNAYVCERREN